MRLIVDIQSTADPNYTVLRFLNELDPDQSVSVSFPNQVKDNEEFNTVVEDLCLAVRDLLLFRKSR